MSTFKLDNLVWRAGEVSANSQYSVTADKVVWGTAKSWVNYNGIGTTVNRSFNVSSVTRAAAGNYTVNYTTSFADIYYSLTTGCNRTDNSSDGYGMSNLVPNRYVYGAQILMMFYNGSTYEAGYIGATVTR